MTTTPFSLELTQPAWLLASAALLVVVYYFFRSLVDFARWQRLTSLAARTLIVSLVVLALSGLTLVRPTHEQYVVLAVDQSLSVGDEAAKTTEAFLNEIAERRGPHRIAYLPFAAAPGLAKSERPSGESAFDRQGTNLAAVIEAAAGSAPPAYVPQIVLLTDGNQTEGDALRAALRADRAGPLRGPLRYSAGGSLSPGSWPKSSREQ